VIVQKRVWLIDRENIRLLPAHTADFSVPVMAASSRRGCVRLHTIEVSAFWKTGHIVHPVAMIRMLCNAAPSSHWTMVHQRGLRHMDLSTKPETPPLSSIIVGTPT
jgi:hypothetical protein